MTKEDFIKVGFIYFLNKIYIVFLIWLARDVLYPFLPAITDGWAANVVFDSLLHWDAGWYIRIAAQGYDFDSAPFFPMFPFLIRMLSYVVGSTVTAGFLISNTALFVACCFLYRITKEEFHEQTAATAVFVMLFFPTAIFFSTVYSESLLLAFVLASFYFARQKRWWWAIFMGCCAVLTRNVGVVVFFALLYMQYRDNDKKIILKEALPLLLIPASLSIFLFVLWLQTGDPLAFSHSLTREYWGYRHFAYPGAGQLPNLYAFFFNNEFYGLFESGTALLFFLLIIISFTHLKDKSLFIFLVLGFLIPFSSVVGHLPENTLLRLPEFLIPYSSVLGGTSWGMPRYILVLFPGYMVLAGLLHKYGLTQMYSIITVIIFSATSILFVVGRWIS